MQREEQIKEAYKDYLNDGGMLQSNPWFAFKAGAKWADEKPNLESLWHNASEEPTEYPIICQDENGYFWIQYNHYDWECYTEETELSQWAYIKDLLPKGKINYDR